MGKLEELQKYKETIEKTKKEIAHFKEELNFLENRADIGFEYWTGEKDYLEYSIEQKEQLLVEINDKIAELEKSEELQQEKQLKKYKDDIKELDKRADAGFSHWTGEKEYLEHKKEELEKKIQDKKEEQVKQSIPVKSEEQTAAKETIETNEPRQEKTKSSASQTSDAIKNERLALFIAAVLSCEEKVKLQQEFANLISNESISVNDESYRIAIAKLEKNQQELSQILNVLPTEEVEWIIKQYPAIKIKKKVKEQEKPVAKQVVSNNVEEQKKQQGSKTKTEQHQEENKEEKIGTKKEIEQEQENKNTQKEKSKKKNKKRKGIIAFIKDYRKKRKEKKEKEKAEKTSQEENSNIEIKQEKKEKTKKEKKGWSLRKRITSLILAGVMLFYGGYSFGKNAPNKNADENVNSRTSIEQMDENYDEYTYEELLNASTIQSQKTTMKNVGQTLDGYNDIFANNFKYVDENGNVIKPALTWDETMALTMAYNDHSKADIKAIFNGATINSSDYSNAYKMANLQLMGAHIIETKENPVDMSYLINTEEGKAFYEKYHQKYLELKGLKGQALEEKVKEFRADIRKDFPITDEIREEGLSHSESREIESYKLSVVPMIGAFEMQYRNVAVNEETLNDKEIDYLNDTALCNIADEKYDIIQSVTWSSEIDPTQPSYEDFKYAKIDELAEEENYNIADAARDPSKLPIFQEIINAHFDIKNGKYTGEIYYDNGSTYSKSKTTHKTETTRENADMPQSEKDKIDNAIDKENEKAKEEAQKEADKKQEEIQKEADKETEKNIEEVEKDDKDMQDKIDDANDKIENGDEVNEDDFGDHDVDFDDEYSDEDGTLDDSVEDITTDPTDDATNEPLPDPEETGKDFDGKVITQTTQGGTGNTTDQNIFEYEVELIPNETKEKYANKIVEEMANNTSTNESSKQLTLQNN